MPSTLITVAIQYLANISLYLMLLWGLLGLFNIFKSLCSATVIPSLLCTSSVSANSCGPHMLLRKEATLPSALSPVAKPLVSLSILPALESGSWDAEIGRLTFPQAPEYWVGLDDQMSACPLHVIVVLVPGPKHRKDCFTLHSYHMAKWHMHSSLSLTGISNWKTFPYLCKKKNLQSIYDIQIAMLEVAEYTTRN